jgi:hypothetical protein
MGIREDVKKLKIQVKDSQTKEWIFLVAEDEEDLEEKKRLELAGRGVNENDVCFVALII